ncbi:response regulator [Bifidobacterium callitrichos]|nr:response regulator [Bifidobacterium callitrichos]
MPAIVEAGVLDNDVLALERMAAILPKLLPGLTVSWSTTSAQEAVRRCLDPQWRPMLLIADVELDGTTGMDVCRQIRYGADHPFVLAVSSFSPRTYAAEAVAGRRAGACGQGQHDADGGGAASCRIRRYV